MAYLIINWKNEKHFAGENLLDLGLSKELLAVV
jgi:hypothetical protein